MPGCWPAPRIMHACTICRPSSRGAGEDLGRLRARVEPDLGHLLVLDLLEYADTHARRYVQAHLVELGDRHRIEVRVSGNAFHAGQRGVDRERPASPHRAEGLPALFPYLVRSGSHQRPRPSLPSLHSPEDMAFERGLPCCAGRHPRIPAWEGGRRGGGGEESRWQRCQPRRGRESRVSSRDGVDPDPLAARYRTVRSCQRIALIPPGGGGRGQGARGATAGSRSRGNSDRGPVRGIKESPPYLHCCLTLEDKVEFSTSCSS